MPMVVQKKNTVKKIFTSIHFAINNVKKNLK